MCQQILDRLAEVDDLPNTLLTTCNMIYQEVEDKFEGCGQNTIVTVIFLRLLCPAIVSPHTFDLVDRKPHPLHARSLVLMSKLIQVQNTFCLAQITMH